MAGSRGEGADAVGLVHWEGGVEEAAVVIVLEALHARFGVDELVDVTRHIHHR